MYLIGTTYTEYNNVDYYDISIVHYIVYYLIRILALYEITCFITFDE